MWEKILLSKNYAKALEEIDAQLQYWPKFLIHKNKQRLTKIHQYLIRTRRLALKAQPTIVGIHKKVERREERREAKAIKAARLTNAIKNELVNRLKSGMYPDEVYNVPQQAYDQAVDTVGQPDQIESETEEEDNEPEFVEDYENEGDEKEENLERESEDELSEELDEAQLKELMASQAMKSGKRPRREVEYEVEEEEEQQEKEVHRTKR